jgi:hypothetical protein
VIDFIAVLGGMAAWSVGANETAGIELPTARSAGLENRFLYQFTLR